MTGSRPGPEDLAAELAGLLRTGVTAPGLRGCPAILALDITQARAPENTDADKASAAHELLSQAVVSVDGERNGVAATLLGLATGTRGALLMQRRAAVANRLAITVDHFRRDREEPLVEQVAEELYTMDAAHRLRQRHRTAPERPSTRSRLGIDWLDRHQAYRRVWTPVTALRSDVQVLLRFVRDEATPGFDLASRAMNLNWRLAQFSRQLDRFVEDYGGLWLLADVESEVEAADAIGRIGFHLPLGEEDLSWLRITLAEAPHGELDGFADALLERREEARILVDTWVKWAQSCRCDLEAPDPDTCEVHLWMSHTERFIRLIDADWYRIADFYRASDANIHGEDIGQLWADFDKRVQPPNDPPG
jgi:hypothetical protein